MNTQTMNTQTMNTQTMNTQTMNNTTLNTALLDATDDRPSTLAAAAVMSKVEAALHAPDLTGDEGAKTLERLRVDAARSWRVRRDCVGVSDAGVAVLLKHKLTADDLAALPSEVAGRGELHLGNGNLRALSEAAGRAASDSDAANLLLYGKVAAGAASVDVGRIVDRDVLMDAGIDISTPEGRQQWTLIAHGRISGVALGLEDDYAATVLTTGLLELAQPDRVRQEATTELLLVEVDRVGGFLDSAATSCERVTRNLVQLSASITALEAEHRVVSDRDADPQARRVALSELTGLLDRFRAELMAGVQELSWALEVGFDAGCYVIGLINAQEEERKQREETLASFQRTSLSDRNEVAAQHTRALESAEAGDFENVRAAVLVVGAIANANAVTFDQLCTVVDGVLDEAGHQPGGHDGDGGLSSAGSPGGIQTIGGQGADERSLSGVASGEPDYYRPGKPEVRRIDVDRRALPR